MDAALATDKAISKARGRKDTTGTEVVMQTKPIKEMLKDLILLETRRAAATEKFNDQVKAVAEKAGFLSSVVRRIVKAHAGESFEEEKRKVEQLGIVFDEVGAENK
jgi:hypothetical protein